jgi:hypothetical protein
VRARATQLGSLLIVGFIATQLAGETSREPSERTPPSPETQGPTDVIRDVPEPDAPDATLDELERSLDRTMRRLDAIESATNRTRLRIRNRNVIGAVTAELSHWRSACSHDGCGRLRRSVRRSVRTIRVVLKQYPYGAANRDAIRVALRWLDDSREQRRRFKAGDTRVELPAVRRA